MHLHCDGYRSTEVQLSGDEGQMDDVPLEEEKKNKEDDAYDLITEEEVAQSMHESMIEPSLHDPKYFTFSICSNLLKTRNVI